MPFSGLFLTTKDAKQVSNDLMDIWYGLVIDGREVTQGQKDRLYAYTRYFAGGEHPTDTRADGDTHWPSRGVPYDSKFGDHKMCKCSHPYYRHFDTYDDMEPVGCKYCDCITFEETSNG
jgi:hypothetical protein